MYNKRQNYKTKQRDLILSCLKEQGNCHVSADIILGYLKERGEAVGQTTIYRNLERMVSEGSLIKYEAPDGMAACYQFIGQEEIHTNHYHLVCTECGRLNHLACGSLDRISSHMMENHSFKINKLKTILYGCCDLCLDSTQK